MSLNKYQPYLRIIPEDKEIDQLAFKFIPKYFEPLQVRQIEREDFGGGFEGAEKKFKLLLPELKKEKNCHLLLLVDCDGQTGKEAHQTCSRAEELLKSVPDAFKDRVFILTFEREIENFLGNFGEPKNDVGTKLGTLCDDLENTDIRPQWDRAEKNNLVRVKGTVTRLLEHLQALRG